MCLELQPHIGIKRIEMFLSWKESEKASSHQESNTGHFWLELPVLYHWATTTIQPPASTSSIRPFHFPLFQPQNKMNKKGVQNRQTGIQNRQTGRRTGREGINVAHGTVIHNLLWTHIISPYMSILEVRQLIVSHQPFVCRQAVIIHIRY